MVPEPVFKTAFNPQSSIRNYPILLVIILIAFAVSPLPVLGESSPTVRLLLGQNLPRAVISGDSLLIEKLEEGIWQPVIGRVRMAGFSPWRAGVRLEGSHSEGSLFRVKADKGMLQYAGLRRRGYLTVRNSSGGLVVVSHLPLESYLAGVVNGEIDSSWPLEAVKAQVVAARSYALYQMSRGSVYFDLKTDVTDQVYAGVHSEDVRALEAVEMTRGQVLYKDGELIQAFFHSSCGGSTTSSLDAWGVARPAHESVTCGTCQDAPYARWNLPLSAEEIVEAVQTLVPNLSSLRFMGIHKRSGDGRVKTLYLETGEGRVLVDAGEFRKQIGYRRLPSTRFALGKSGERIILTGTGYGHGVGLCQWGARGSASRGMDYRQILRKYYLGTEIRHAY